MTEFFHMGGYGFFVWSCFGLTAIVLIVNAIQPINRHRNLIRDIKGQLARDAQKIL